MLRHYLKLPARVRIIVAWTFSVLVMCPVCIVDGIARGAVEGWLDYKSLHKEGMGNLHKDDTP